MTHLVKSMCLIFGHAFASFEGSKAGRETPNLCRGRCSFSNKTELPDLSHSLQIASVQTEADSGEDLACGEFRRIEPHASGFRGQNRNRASFTGNVGYDRCGSAASDHLRNVFAQRNGPPKDAPEPPATTASSLLQSAAVVRFARICYTLASNRSLSMQLYWPSLRPKETLVNKPCLGNLQFSRRYRTWKHQFPQPSVI